MALRQFNVEITCFNGAIAKLSDQEITSFTVDTAMSQKNKFFGVVVSQKLTLELVSQLSHYTFNKGDLITLQLTTVKPDISNYNLFADFYVDEVDRDAESNKLTIKATDAMEKLQKKVISDSGLIAPYTAWDLLQVACDNRKIVVESEIQKMLQGMNYPEGANLNGNETLYDILIAFTELIGGYAYCKNDSFYLQKLNIVNTNQVNANEYFKLTLREPHSLHKIILGNSLGDNVFVETANPGETMFIRDNPLLDNRDDKINYIQMIIDFIGDYQFKDYSISWRGNKNNLFDTNLCVLDKSSVKYLSPVFNNKITYDGGLRVESSWGYEPEENETFANPATVGERISQATAKVDKVNKKIELVVLEAEKNNEAIQENISRIDQDSKSISASVEQVKKDLAATSNDLNGSIGELTERVNATMTQDQVKIEIEKEIAKGTDKVTTGTGFTFNEDGLTVSKKNNVMTTQITENGMYITESGNTVLSANNVGVDAKNLHATTYLIVGQNSRFEDYGIDQTGCFWIGPGFGGLRTWR